MEGSWPENLATINQKKVINDELMEGREIANKLRSLLSNSGDDSKSAKDLVIKIMKSFSNTLSMLNVKEGDIAGSMISQIQAHSSCLDASKSEGDSQESCRSSNITPIKKDRRSFHNRRRPLQTWQSDTPTLIDDGQAWRKYGQKVILQAEYPRHYFRCTYKYDQGCKATKQVQRIQVNPPLYRTTYFGHHTCKIIHKGHEVVMEDTNPIETSIFISFDSSNLTNKQDQHPFLSSFSSIKDELKEDIKKCDTNKNQSYSCDYFVSPDSMVTQLPKSMMELSSTLESKNKDLIYEIMECDDFSFNMFQI
ncbi:hypothetical protein FEM48_Zijuj04G0084500 [Ziziphus jujuba var. spinosa]|uniref:WRKY domain-containing protein n=1 Tax=Ziziphus jujuba var. spinosa TaxID=714518 RepID=A0A978VIU3_ZIZJJ|nr:hypothetical protein FEM48_Zijuj04G0084500 [Ziziphus jujuba var. spinosa]